MKVAFVSVLAHRDGDYSNHGITSRFNYLNLYSECTREEALADIEKRGCNIDECLLFVRDHVGMYESCYCVPVVEKQSGMIGPMFGGNFVYTSNCNGTFPTLSGVRWNTPLPVHDRYETQEEYDFLSM